MQWWRNVTWRNTLNTSDDRKTAISISLSYKGKTHWIGKAKTCSSIIKRMIYDNSLCVSAPWICIIVKKLCGIWTWFFFSKLKMMDEVLPTDHRYFQHYKNIFHKFLVFTSIQNLKNVCVWRCFFVLSPTLSILFDRKYTKF